MCKEDKYFRMRTNKEKRKHYSNSHFFLLQSIMFLGFFLVFFNYKEGLSRKNNFKKKSLRLEVDDTKKVFFFWLYRYWVALKES